MELSFLYNFMYMHDFAGRIETLESQLGESTKKVKELEVNERMCGERE